VGESRATFWRESIKVLEGHDALEVAHHLPFWLGILPAIAGIIGIGIAYGLYIRSPETPRRLAERYRGLYQFLLNKWYFDELYDRIFVRPTFWLGNFLWKVGDIKIINGLIDGTAAAVYGVTQRAVRIQTGYVYHYAFVMLIGVALLVSYFMFMGGPR